MRILLGQNSLYYPSHGGGDKSNRLLVEALAARGHECRVLARIPVFGEQEKYLAMLAARGVQTWSTGNGMVRFERAGVDVGVVTEGRLRAHFADEIAAFRPETILTSTDDPAQLLLETALEASARVVYLARATLAVPFGPDCAFPSQVKTARLRSVDAVVGVSQYVADYCRRYGGIDAIHVPISLVEPEEWPALGRFDGEFVTMVNPCAVKGISIFLALADAFPEVAFAAVPTWGTNEQDRAALRARSNATLLDPVDDVNLLFARTRVLLVPSLWAEARSRIVLEAMLRGVPVMAANTGGIPEAKMGVPYLLPVNPIVHFETRLDEQMVPVAEVPKQDLGPWREALARLLTDRAHYEEIAAASRKAALEYAANLSVEPFERLLERLQETPIARDRAARAASQSSAAGVGVAAAHADGVKPSLSPEKRRLLALRLRKAALPAAWFPGIETARGPRLFAFPHAGGGALRFGQPVRLPGRESRLAEAPFERMAPLVSALATAIEPYTREPYAFFGHSMGAAVAFELARELRRRGLPLPKLLIASAARAPQFRRNWVPPPAPGPAAFLEELRRLEGIPPEALDDPAVLRAVLPALEADAALYRNYIYQDDAPLPFPICAYGGSDDPNIRAEHLAAWKEQTAAAFKMRLFPGGHFYLRTSPDQFAAAIEEDLALAR